MSSPERENFKFDAGDEASPTFYPSLTEEGFQELRRSIKDDEQFVEAHLLKEGLTATDKEREAILDLVRFVSEVATDLNKPSSAMDLHPGASASRKCEPSSPTSSQQTEEALVLFYSSGGEGRPSAARKPERKPFASPLRKAILFFKGRRSL